VHDVDRGSCRDRVSFNPALANKMSQDASSTVVIMLDMYICTYKLVSQFYMLRERT
jgi:hypothetical protein